MHDQARIALDLGHIAPVVVDPVGIEEQRGIAKQHGFVRQEALPRSEEHTSELQSLMRISYAVFCLKKKKTNLSTLFLHTRFLYQEDMSTNITNNTEQQRINHSKYKLN